MLTRREIQLKPEVSLSVNALNTLHSYVLYNAGTAFVWHGKYANDKERDRAKHVASNVLPRLLNDSSIRVVELEEGQEESAFWSALNHGNRNV